MEKNIDINKTLHIATQILFKTQKRMIPSFRYWYYNVLGKLYS